MTEELGGRQPDGQRSGASSERLSGLVAARICHDIAGPMVAITNGMELLAEIGSTRGEEFRLVDDSARRMTLLLKLLRLAFGLADDSGSALSAREVRKRLDVLAGPRVAVTVDAAEDVQLRPSLARLAVLMTLATRALLGGEGRIRLSVQRDGLPMAAEAMGDRARWSEARQKLANGDAGDATAREVEFLLLAPAARAAGARLSRIAEPGRAGLSAQSVSSPSR